MRARLGLDLQSNKETKQNKDGVDVEQLQGFVSADTVEATWPRPNPTHATPTEVEQIIIIDTLEVELVARIRCG